MNNTKTKPGENPGLNKIMKTKDLIGGLLIVAVGILATLLIAYFGGNMK